MKMSAYKISDNFNGVEGSKVTSPHHFHPTNGVRPVDSNWAPKFPDGTAVLNPENAAPTAMWLSVRAKENIRIFAWIIMLVFGMGMIGGGIKGAVSVLFRDGIFSRWWIGALIAFGGLKLMQYLAVKLKATSPKKTQRKKRKGKSGKDLVPDK